MTMNAPAELTAQRIASPGWTAGEIAIAARLSRRWVLRALAGTAASGSVIVQGNETGAYSFDVLPAGLQRVIGENAGGAGMGIAEYLQSVCKAWAPALGLAEVDAAVIEDAKRLRAALLPALQRMGSKVLSVGDRVRLGLDDYKREMGHVVTGRHWQRLIERTLRRAGASDDFERLELYFPENPKPKHEAERMTPGESEFADLLQLIQGCTDAARPTDGESAAIWAGAFEIFDEASNGKRRKYLRRALVKFLWRHVPALASGQHALRVAFDWKFARWSKGGKSAAALLDGRREKKGIPTAEPFAEGDIKIFEGHTLFNCGGRVAQARRELAASGNLSGLSESMREIILRPAASKSYVNRRLMKIVKNNVQQQMPFVLGKQHIDDITAHVQRDYSKLAAMEVVSADDFTFPVYFYVPDGKGWFTLTRGQCLIFLDVRSWRILGYSLQPDRNYNSLVIRTLMNRVCRVHGIPGTWYFERGIWKRSLLVSGRAPQGWNYGLSPADAQTAWEKLGVNFRYATRARVKPIERVGGLLQDMMHGVRGYCGRDERRDCPEQTKRAKEEVEARRVEHPGELFLSLPEWDEQLDSIIERYNATSQAGIVLNGLSPDEALKNFWPTDDPPAKLDERSWHLLAHYVRPVPVTANGICFRIGQKQFVYRNERTGQDRGKTVLVWFDPENPEFVCVTDANRQNPYLVGRAGMVDFLAEPGDPTLERELSRAAAHGSYYRTRYRTLKATFAPAFRRNIVDVQTATTAEEMRRLRDNHEEQNREKKAAQKSFARIGMSAPNELLPGMTAAATELGAILKKNGTGAISTNAKGETVYQLKASGTAKTDYVNYLLDRLTEFRKQGQALGQHFNQAVTLGITRRIAQSQMGCNVHDESRFEEVCKYLKGKIDETVLGKRNAANGHPSYHDFEAHTQKEETE